MTPVDELVGQAGPELSPASVTGVLPAVLRTLLCKRNGFFAFGRSLLVRPSTTAGRVLGVLEWNESNLWKREYGLELDAIVFFAEDLFGRQFGLMGNDIVVLEPETGEREVVASGVSEWCATVLADPATITGFPLEDAWKRERPALEDGQRLLPKRPFVLGGAYSVENLVASDDAEGLRYRASLAAQIRSVADGEDVVLREG